MNLEQIKKIAQCNTPEVDAKIVANSYRHDVIKPLTGHDNIGIELGVAQGGFSKRMVDSRKFVKFFGVDMYADTHDTDEYKFALKTVGITRNYHLLRMTFDDAYDLFDDDFFDFIYIDGYAHTGEEGGETLAKWYKKLKIGGILAGDDYHSDWPLVMWAVNNFVLQTEAQLYITDKTEDVAFSKYPSWYIIKDAHVDRFEIPPLLTNSAQSEKNRIGAIRRRRLRVRGIERRIKRFFSS